MAINNYFKIDEYGNIKGLTNEGKQKSTITVSDKINNVKIKSISDFAFYKNKNLKSVIIADSITYIGYAAFLGCDNLRSITIPKNVKRIRSDTFNNCMKLSSIKIPLTVTSIGYGAFDNCIKLKNVEYAGTEEQWNKINIDAHNDFIINANIIFMNK